LQFGLKSNGILNIGLIKLSFFFSFSFFLFNNPYVILLLFFLRVFDYFLKYVQSLVPHISGYYREKFLKSGSKILAKDFELRIS